ncbi:MAG: S1 RNA-binding domain-containing protein [Deltaproteobacteria bacterium]|nr:S1 RNA-binding domain-containing protein [Deltaproteobacteria bacterium]MBK8238096.1 S1 RNA-binding domain-containing protein [Deltaproteobacteria bacterium]MBP7290818.1 S1 RNA-binding domain-containing protein [Nannocystaceae bacterium]
MASDDDFAALFEQSASNAPRARKLRAGEVVDGTVVAIGDDTVFVDVGTKAEARLDRGSVVDGDGKLRVGLGDRVRVTVVNPGGREAPIVAMQLGRGDIDVTMLEAAVEGGTPVEGEIVKAVKAGLEVMVGNVRAFCPASQVEIGPSGELANWVGQRHFFRVIEVREGGRSVIVSRRALLQAERAARAEQLLSKLEVGAELEGIVQTIQPYGVFVDLGGVEGLVHISELGHGRVASPNDVVSVGESVRVKVLSIESAAKGGARISLSMKALVQPDAVSSKAPADEVLTGTVARIEGNGIFVDTAQGGGFVPTAELDLPPGGDPRRTYEIGQSIEVVLLRRDAGGKLRLSVRKVAEAEARRNFRDFRSGVAKAGTSLGSLGDLFKGRLPSVPAGPARSAAAEPGDAAREPRRKSTDPAVRTGKPR